MMDYRTAPKDGAGTRELLARRGVAVETTRRRGLQLEKIYGGSQRD